MIHPCPHGLKTESATDALHPDLYWCKAVWGLGALWLSLLVGFSGGAQDRTEVVGLLALEGRGLDCGFQEEEPFQFYCLIA